MRLIDADELKKAIEQGEGFSWDSHGKDDLCVRKKYIDNAPTVNDCPNCEYKLEADYIRSSSSYKELIDLRKFKEEPTRPHGEWLHPYKINIACECSICGIQMPITDYFNFCPNCGADMRGGAE